MGPGTYRDRDERGPGSPTSYREGANRDRGPGGYREGEHRGPGSYRDRAPGISGTIGQRPRQPMEGGPGHGPRPGGIGEQRPERPYAGGQKGGKPASPGGRPAKAWAPKPATPPRPKREKIPPPLPFTPTDEQIKQVEERYLELSTPAEYDGIRTQIAKELTIPKKAVKKIVKELRDRQGIPSWWELQTYKGDAEELEKIRAAYEPYLPLPNIGVHKTIADELAIKPGDVYQAIKLIRQEMGLPQYNDPTLHGIELRSMKKKDSVPQEELKIESKEEHAELAAPATDAETPKDQITEAPAPTTDTETASDQAVEASNRAGASPAPTMDETETPSDQVNEATSRAGASPAPTMDETETPSDQAVEALAAASDSGTVSDEGTEVQTAMTDTSTDQASEATESSEAPEAVAVTRVEGNTNGEE